MASQQVLWQQGQPVACAAVASKDTEQELQMGTLAMGGRGPVPTHSQAGNLPDLEVYNQWRRLSEKDLEPRGREPTISSKLG